MCKEHNVHNHHRLTSFNTFARKVLGSAALSENEFENSAGKLSYSMEVVDEMGAQCLQTTLRSPNFNNETKAELEAKNDVSGMSVVHDHVYLYHSMLNELLTAIESASGEHLSLRLKEVEIILRNDINLTDSTRQTIITLATRQDCLLTSFDVVVDIALHLQLEGNLLASVLEQLKFLMESQQFISHAPNMRALQQFIAVTGLTDEIKAALLKVKPVGNGLTEDAFVSLLLSVVTKPEEMISILERHNLTEPSSLMMSYERIIETLSRSPIKVNFVSKVPFLTKLLGQLDTARTPHAKLLFRAYYFGDTTCKTWLTNYPFNEVLEKVLTFNSKDFNELYRDVRRSVEKPLEADELILLLEKVDVESLSFDKLVYLYSLLPSDLEESEKLNFLCKGLISCGFSTINSEESLTLCASLGLKQVCSEIINDVLRAYGLKPVLPQTQNYDLKNIFTHVLESNELEMAQDEGMVTVIVTTFNPDVFYLEQSINSILNQNYPNIEVIVIDDCSDLETSEAIKTLCDIKSGKNIQYHRNETNVGQYLSRNTAIAMAKGKFIAIQDDDDVSHPERIATQVRAIANNEALACFSQHVRYSDSGTLSVDDPRNLLALGDGPATLMFKRTLIQLIGGFRNYRSRGDIDFRTRIETIVGKSAITRVDVPLYFMRSSLTTVSSLYEYLNGDQLTFFRRKINLLKTKKASEEVFINE